MLRSAPASSPSRARRAEVATFSAPIGGWISNRALADPNGNGLPQGAARLDNFFPTATGCILRRGSRNYAQISNSGQPVVSLFKYIVGENARMFGATDTAIYDLTNVNYSENITLADDDGNLLADEDGNTIGENSAEGLAVYENTTDGDWVTVQFGTTGGTYLVGVNGNSTAFVFDGSDFMPYSGSDVNKLNYDTGTADFTAGATLTGGTSGATATIYKVVPSTTAGEGTLWLTGITGGPFQNNEALTDGDGGSALANGTVVLAIAGVTFPAEFPDLTTADLAFVWVYKEALYFIEKNSLRAWYLPPDQISGELAAYPLNGFLDKGGSLLWGQSWSLASSDAGGLSAQNVFTTTEGESAVFQGLSPEDATWAMVGVYSVGKPLGKHGFIRAGGDIVIATDVGDVALSKAVQVDLSVLAPNAVSYAIQVDWNEAISERGRNWQCEVWPEGQMAIVIPPNSDSLTPVWFVSNVSTGAWAPFYNWYATCVLAWQGRLFFGSKDGFVIEAMVGGADSGQPYTGVYVPLFSDVQKPTAYKTGRMARIEAKSAAPINEKVSCLFDFDTNLPAPAGPSVVPVGNEWENAIWDQSIWNANRNAIITKRRHSVSGAGYRIAPVFQVTSGAAIPLDVEIITVDLTFESGDAFS